MNFFDVPEIYLNNEQREMLLLDIHEGSFDEMHEEPFNVFFKDDHFQFIKDQLLVEPSAIYVLKLRSGWDCPPHVDDEYEHPRYSSMIIPLYPYNDDYMPLRYLDRNNQPTDIIGYRDHAFVTDTTKLHHVVNNKFDRYNIQISFKQKIDELYDLYTSDKLVRRN